MRQIRPVIQSNPAPRARDKGTGKPVRTLPVAQIQPTFAALTRAIPATNRVTPAVAIRRPRPIPGANARVIQNNPATDKSSIANPTGSHRMSSQTNSRWDVPPIPDAATAISANAAKNPANARVSASRNS